jgi:hypothetical protein
MSGIDFLLAGPVAQPELRGALAEALGEHAIEIVADAADLAGGQPLFAIVHEVGGDFRTHVSLDPRGDLETVRAVSRFLGMNAITPDDDTANPYAMILVHPDGRTERVTLQPGPLDERDEYRLSGRP